MTEPTKLCSKCKKNKPYSDFSPKASASTGRQSQCKQCKNEREAGTDSAHNTRRREQWAEKDADAKREWSLLKKYGITLAKYNEMLEAQGGVCMICKQPPTARGLAVDHDHTCCPGQETCGQCLRDLLCFRCNSGIGSLGECVKIILSAARYLIKWRKR